MEELIKKVTERAGIDASQAQSAIDAVLETLQDKLPDPIASQLRNALDGNADFGDIGDKLKGMAGGLGGMLGR